MDRSSGFDREKELSLLRRAEQEGLIDPDQRQEAEKIFRRVEELGVPMAATEILTQRGFASLADLERIRAGRPADEPAPVERPPVPPPPKPRAPEIPAVDESEALRLATLAMKGGLLPPGDLGTILKEQATSGTPLADLLVRERGLLPGCLEALRDLGREEASPSLTQSDLDLTARAIAAGASPLKVQGALAAVHRLHRDAGFRLSIADALFKMDALDADALDGVLSAVGRPPGGLAGYRGGIRTEEIPGGRLRPVEETCRVAANAGLPLDVGEVLFLEGVAEAAPPPPARRKRRFRRTPSEARAQKERNRAAAIGISVAATVAAVFLLVLAVKVLGGSSSGRSDIGSGGASSRAGRVPGAEEAAREGIDWRFDQVATYALKNPDDIQGIIRRYEDLEEKYAGTADGERARRLVEEFLAGWEKEASDEADLRIERSRTLAEAGDFEEARVVLSSFPRRYDGTPAGPRVAEALKEIDRIEETLALRAEKEARARREAEERERAEAEARARETRLAGAEKDRVAAALGRAHIHVMNFAYAEAILSLEKSRDRSRSQWAAAEIDRHIPDLRAQEELFRRLIGRLNEEGERPEVGFGSGSTLRVTGADAEGVSAASDQITLKKPWVRIVPEDIAALLEWAGTWWADPFAIATFAYDHGVAGWGDRVLLGVAETDPAGVSSWIAARRGVDLPDGGFVHYQGEWIPKVEADHLARGEVLFGGEWRSREELVADLRTARRERDRKRIRRRAMEEAAAKAKKLLDTEGIAEIEPLHETGDVSRRVDIAIVSDGFTEEEAGAVRNRAAWVKRGILEAPPFSNYQKYINIHLVRLVEVESGINQPPEKPRKTKVGSTLQGNVLTCDIGAAWKYGKFAPDCDLVVVVANVSGGRATGGGGVVTLNKDGSIDDVVIHELGHAYGDLDDEYVDPGIAPGRNYGPDEEGAHINTTRESDRRNVKWHYWNFPPLENNIVGCFEGAYYHDKGYYRPSRTCRMRASSTPNFCLVCQEHMERKFYRQLEPLERAWPEDREVFVWADEKARFGVEGIFIEDKSGRAYGSFHAEWYVDGERTTRDVSAGAKNGLAVSPGEYPPGRHEVVVQVELRNSRIRRDDGRLSSTRVWSLVISPHKRPGIDAPDEVSGRMRRAISFQVKPKDVPEEAGFRVEVRDLPRGATFDPEGGLFRWIPDRYQRGLYRVTFVLGKDGHSVSRVVEIKVRGGVRNSGPVMKYVLPPEGEEGEAMTFTVEAIDVDGDHLTFWGEKLPRGATLDPETGVFRWTPGLLQAETYVVRLLVADAERVDEQEITLQVRDRPMGIDFESYSDMELNLALRSPNVGLAALDEASGRLGETLLLYEHARRMRFRDPVRAREAMDAVRGMLVYQTGGWRRDLLLHFLKAMEPHCRQFVDAPEFLGFLEELAQAGAAIEGLDKFNKGKVRAVLSELEAIRRYNEERRRETGNGGARVMADPVPTPRASREIGRPPVPASRMSGIWKGGIRPWPRHSSCSGPTRARRRTSRTCFRETPMSSRPI